LHYAHVTQPRTREKIQIEIEVELKYQNITKFLIWGQTGFGILNFNLL